MGRYERKHSKFVNSMGNSMHGMNESDFQEFERMLPRRYKTRFLRMGTFHAFANEHSIVDHRHFANALDTFTEMEVDNHDIDIDIDVDVGTDTDIGSPRHRRRKRREAKNNVLFAE